MTIYELDTGWASTPRTRRVLHWELAACDDVAAAFPTNRDDVLAVLFDGDPGAFRAWARTLAAEAVR
jgi:hypothetical protein